VRPTISVDPSSGAHNVTVSLSGSGFRPNAWIQIQECLPGPDLPAALHGIPAGAPVIVLSHRPDTARTIAAAGVMLELAGHTHGGQVLGPSLVTRWVNHGFVSGLYRVGAMQLYVSNGTGLWAGLALRIGRPSEITQIILHQVQPDH
jgi:predicted MPP superfamily phosphohydrolase